MDKKSIELWSNYLGLSVIRLKNYLNNHNIYLLGDSLTIRIRLLVVWWLRGESVVW